MIASSARNAASAKRAAAAGFSAANFFVTTHGSITDVPATAPSQTTSKFVLSLTRSMSGEESVIPEATSPERSDWRVTGGSSGTTFIFAGSTLKCFAHANRTCAQVLFGTEPIGLVT